eukprot:899266-Ditylum_brightwellii.AAC.1
MAFQAFTGSVWYFMQFCANCFTHSVFATFTASANSFRDARNRNLSGSVGASCAIVWAALRALWASHSRTRVSLLRTNQGLSFSGLPFNRVCSTMLIAERKSSSDGVGNLVSSEELHRRRRQLMSGGGSSGVRRECFLKKKGSGGVCGRNKFSLVVCNVPAGGRCKLGGGCYG